MFGFTDGSQESVRAGPSKVDTNPKLAGVSSQTLEGRSNAVCGLTSCTRKAGGLGQRGGDSRDGFSHRGM